MRTTRTSHITQAMNKMMEEELAQNQSRERNAVAPLPHPEGLSEQDPELTKPQTSTTAVERLPTTQPDTTK